MSNVADFKARRLELDDKKITEWLIAGGMPKDILELISQSLIDMRRTVKHPTPELGWSHTARFRRMELPGGDTTLWQVGRDLLYPITFMYSVPFASEAIEELYHGSEHEFIFSTFKTEDVNDVTRDMFNNFMSKFKLTTEDVLSPLLFFLNEGIARSFSYVQPTLVMGGYSTKAKAYMVIIQSEVECIQWVLYYEEFLKLPLDPPKHPSEE